MLLFQQNALAQFTDISASNSLQSFSIGIEQFGNGLSFCDFNNDGWDDLTIATGANESIKFFENQNGTFVPIILPISVTDDSKQVLWVDYDNDGDKDFFVTNFIAQNRLFRNDGNLQFTDVTTTCGLLQIQDKSYGATFGDYNNDGFLDVYISNRDNEGTGHTNFLYKNNGDGSFTDVSVDCQCFDGKRTTFCAAFLDADRDGDQDLYLAQDRNVGNVFFRNNNDGTFSSYSNASGANQQMDAMNVGVADYDNDQDLDIYVTNTPIGGNELFRNEGNFTYTEQGDNAGVSFNYTGWGANFFDYDNDGFQDLYVSSMLPSSTEPNLLYVNNTDGTFFKLIPEGFVGDTMTSYANVISDFDKDGDIDVLVSNNTPYHASLWQNDLANNHHYLQVDIRGVNSNRDGVGTWIEAFTDNQVLTRYTHCGEAYLAQNSTTSHIGLGMNSTIDSLRLQWLSGTEDIIYDVIPNERLIVPEGSTITLSESWTQFELTATNNEIELNWTVPSIDNIQSFMIQRSEDGFDFETLQTIASNSNPDYSFMDNTIVNNTLYYYRLIQVKNDNRQEYSVVKTGEVTVGNTNWLTAKVYLGNAYPNPTHDGQVFIPYSSEELIKISIQVTNIYGQVLPLTTQSVLNGEGQLKIDVKPYGTGVYWITLKTQNSIITKRIEWLN